MRKGDRTVEKAADRLEVFVKNAQSDGGLRGRVGGALAGDPDFLRKLKPSLIAERARGNMTAGESSSGPEHAPSVSQPTDAKAAMVKQSSANPWTVLVGALAAGYALAKAIDWRGDAHSRD